MMYAIVTSDNDFSVSVMELYFMELFNVCYGTEQLWVSVLAHTSVVKVAVHLWPVQRLVSSVTSCIEI